MKMNKVFRKASNQRKQNLLYCNQYKNIHIHSPNPQSKQSALHTITTSIESFMYQQPMLKGEMWLFFSAYQIQLLISRQSIQSHCAIRTIMHKIEVINNQQQRFLNETHQLFCVCVYELLSNATVLLTSGLIRC